MAKKTKSDVLISGGGIAGLALAALLGRERLKVHIIEPAPPAPLAKTAVAARTVALMDSSVNVIKATGAWEKIAVFAAPLKTMRIIDDSMAGRGDVEAAFHARDIGLAQFGFNVPNGVLRAALFEAVKKNKNIYVHQSALTNYCTGEETVIINLADGTEISAPLLVGADGRNSRVRDIAGIGVSEKDYGQSAITCILSHTRPHGDTSTEFHRPSGPFALVPMRGNKCAVVWVEKSEKADALMRLRKDEFIRALQRNSKNVLGTVTLESGPECWPLKTLKAKSLTAPRAALIAEAAHVMSPITAQGLNLSLRDAASLAETIIDAARLGLDIGAENVLRKYERRRVADIGIRVFGVDRMNSLVSADFEFIKGLRRRGLKAALALPSLKKLAMRHGLASDIDLARVARGEAL